MTDPIEHAFRAGWDARDNHMGSYDAETDEAWKQREFAAYKPAPAPAPPVARTCVICNGAGECTGPYRTCGACNGSGVAR